MTHLVGIRSIPVRHNLCLPVTYQVHLGRERNQEPSPREPPPPPPPPLPR